MPPTRHGQNCVIQQIPPKGPRPQRQRQQRPRQSGLAAGACGRDGTPGGQGLGCWVLNSVGDVLSPKFEGARPIHKALGVRSTASNPPQQMAKSSISAIRSSSCMCVCVLLLLWSFRLHQNGCRSNRASSLERRTPPGDGNVSGGSRALFLWFLSLRWQLFGGSIHRSLRVNAVVVVGWCPYIYSHTHVPSVAVAPCIKISALGRATSQSCLQGSPSR